jgi:hypothetical protein
MQTLSNVKLQNALDKKARAREETLAMGRANVPRARAASSPPRSPRASPRSSRRSGRASGRTSGRQSSRVQEHFRADPRPAQPQHPEARAETAATVATSATGLRAELLTKSQPNRSAVMRSPNVSTCPTVHAEGDPQGIVARLRHEASRARRRLKRARREHRREARAGGEPNPAPFREPFRTAHARLYAHPLQKTTLNDRHRNDAGSYHTRVERVRGQRAQETFRRLVREQHGRVSHDVRTSSAVLRRQLADDDIRAASERSLLETQMKVARRRAQRWEDKKTWSEVHAVNQADRERAMVKYKRAMHHQMQTAAVRREQAAEQQRLRAAAKRERKRLAQAVERAATSLLGLRRNKGRAGGKGGALGAWGRRGGRAPPATLAERRRAAAEEAARTAARLQFGTGAAGVPRMPGLLPPPPSTAAHRSAGFFFPPNGAPFATSATRMPRPEQRQHDLITGNVMPPPE